MGDRTKDRNMLHKAPNGDAVLSPNLNEVLMKPYDHSSIYTTFTKKLIHTALFTESNY